VIAVSVVIPAYNAGHYIADALASIAEQTLRDVEVIVVDDGSTDDTLHIVGGFATSIELVVIRQENGGPAAARNVGIRRARGRYCAFLDADDVMLPDRLEEQVALFYEDSELALVHSDLMTFDERGIIHRTRRAFSKPSGGMILERLLIDNFITTSTVMAPTQRLFDAGLFNEGRRVSEDFELWLRFAARWKVAYIDHPLVRYRRRPGSLSEDKLLTARSALDVIETFWNAHPDYRRSHPALHRKSLARHLGAAGTAALVWDTRRTALDYLVRALGKDPLEGDTWRSIAKALLPFRRVHSAVKPESVESA
jgi:glycosyltransferase involved in cell wall biosynthesis